MRIAIVGAGGVGGYFGGRLAEAGEDVVFIARGRTLEALRQDGLRIESPKGDARLGNVQATANAEDAGAVDVVIVAVKAWQLPEAMSAMRPMVGPETAVLPLLNGVEAAGRIAVEFGRDRVLNGLCGIVAHIEAPGFIRHVGAEPMIRLGELDNRKTARVEKLAAAIVKSGVDGAIPDDIDVAIWQKFLMIGPASGVGAVSRTPYGIWLDTPEVRDLLDRAMAETYAVGRALGVGLGQANIDQAMALLRAAPPNGLTSMQRDIQSGRPSELDAQTGAIVRLGAEAGVPTPVNDVIYRALLPQERRARGQVQFD